MITILINNFLATFYNQIHEKKVQDHPLFKIKLAQKYTMTKINISHMEKYLNYLVDEVFYILKLYSRFYSNMKSYCVLKI